MICHRMRKCTLPCCHRSHSSRSCECVSCSQLASLAFFPCSSWKCSRCNKSHYFVYICSFCIDDTSRIKPSKSSHLLWNLKYTFFLHCRNSSEMFSSRTFFFNFQVAFLLLPQTSLCLICYAFTISLPWAWKIDTETLLTLHFTFSKSSNFVFLSKAVLPIIDWSASETFFRNHLKFWAFNVGYFVQHFNYICN